jgi:hypothetical protein
MNLLNVTLWLINQIVGLLCMIPLLYLCFLGVGVLLQGIEWLGIECVQLWNGSKTAWTRIVSTIHKP